MNRVPLADGHLAYEEHGAGPPLVLLHDGTLDRRVWEPQRGAFPGYRVIALDARGHGESATPTVAYDRGDDVVALLDHLDIGAAHLVGQAMGGTSALDTALDHPDRVLSLVVSGAGTSEQHWQSPFVVDLLAEQAECASRWDADGYIECFLRLWVDGPTRAPDAVDPAVRESCRAMALHTATRHARPDPVMPGRAVDTWARLPTVSAPLLAVVGAWDCTDVHEMARRIVSSVPDAKLEIIDGTGRMVNMERPDRFAETVRRFLDGLPDRTAT